MYNSITAAAYLVKDPEVRTTNNGKKVVSLRAGISTSNAKTKCFVDIEYWDKTAEIAEKYLSKGREFIVNGELCMSSWEKDGKKFSKYFVRGKDLQFLSSKKSEGDSDNSSNESGSSDVQGDDVPF
jgi:single-strand DNA-binding protein|tara:strand:+ start:25 stop:402 length:378 start_codon:yes stop_codon:yes gene_type:complete